MRFAWVRFLQVLSNGFGAEFESVIINRKGSLNIDVDYIITYFIEL